MTAYNTQRRWSIAVSHYYLLTRLSCPSPRTVPAEPLGEIISRPNRRSIAHRESLDARFLLNVLADESTEYAAPAGRPTRASDPLSRYPNEVYANDE